MSEVENIILRNGSNIKMRLLQQQDAEKLYNYLHNLSAESRSRFGPHAFDKETVYNICNNLTNDTQRFIAFDEEKIIAYMLMKEGMIDTDARRYAQYNMFFDENTTVTYAPSVADTFQNSGLGSKMFSLVLEYIKKQCFHHAVLWGGVQATNARAVHFYEKHGFARIANFWHDNKDNIDMVLSV